MHEKTKAYLERLPESQLRPLAYRWMYRSRRLDERLGALFRRGLVKGTVTQGIGNEATSVGMALPLCPGRDVVGLMHRDVASHLILGISPYEIFCQYMANAESPTHAREGNVHHGNIAARRLPMMSHLGGMLSPTVGATWGARRTDPDVVGLAVIGDGGTSTGSFHEALNIASVRRVPVLFVIENNEYAYSTPTREQYACCHLADRAAGYGIEGKTIDGTDIWEVYTAVYDAVSHMRSTSMPFLLESMTLRMTGHAVYDKAEYVTEEEREAWAGREPLHLARQALVETCGMTEEQIAEVEKGIDEELEEAQQQALKVGRPSPEAHPIHVFAPPVSVSLPAFQLEKATNQTAVTAALDYVLEHAPEGVLFGLDIAGYGSAFKTCKGLYERYGEERVYNMPIAESGILGFALGASQTGLRPIVEFQFGDFITEAITQLGLNCGTWYFRSGSSVPMVVRLPIGGGITLGAFHSGEFDGLLSRFPGLKLLYPTTPQETFEALVAAFYDQNPCIVFEHKLLYTRSKGAIAFDGDVGQAWRPRRYREGAEATVVAFGAMVEVAIAAAERVGCEVDVWNPFSLSPLHLEPIEESVRKTGRLLVVQEAVACSGMGSTLVSQVCCRVGSKLAAPPAIVSSPDQPVPFAPELEVRHRPDAVQVGEVLLELIGAGL